MAAKKAKVIKSDIPRRAPRRPDETGDDGGGEADGEVVEENHEQLDGEDGRQDYKVQRSMLRVCVCV